MYLEHATQRFTSVQLLQAEDRLVGAALQVGALVVSQDTIEAAIQEMEASTGQSLNDGQRSLAPWIVKSPYASGQCRQSGHGTIAMTTPKGPSMNRIRSTAAIAVAIIVLAGCTPPDTDQAQPETAAPEATVEVTEAPVASVRPEVGECWQQDDVSAMLEWASWAGSESVDCSEPHNAVTFAVLDVPAEAQYPADPLPGEERQYDAAVAGVIIQAELQWLQTVYRFSRARWLWYLPTPEQWAAGERWMRIDAAVGGFGPMTDSTNLQPLTGTLEDLLAVVNDLEYDKCIDTPRPANEAGPWENINDSTYVDCLGPHQWTPGGQIFSTSDTYDTALLWDEASDACSVYKLGTESDIWWVQLPWEGQWDLGERDLICWLANY